MNRQFSFWEVMISGVIILVLAFVLIGSLAILYQSNLKLSLAEQKVSCQSILERTISSEFEKASKVYGIQLEQSQLYLKKINSDQKDFSGAAFLSGNELRIFVKQPDNGKNSYFYSIYKLDSNLEFSDTKLVKDIGDPVSTEDLFAGKCHANQSASPFYLRTIKQFKSNKQAIILLMQDEIFNQKNDISSKLYMRRINEFN